MTKNELQKTVNAIFMRVQGEALALGIPVSKHIDPNIIISGRATSKLGSCHKSLIGYEITIAKRVAEAGDYAASCVLAHEILHTCSGCQNHGALWKRYARLMMSAYGYRIFTTTKPEDLGIEQNARYLVKCTRCGAEFPRQRMCSLVERPWRYRCRCGGKLVRIK